MLARHEQKYSSASWVIFMVKMKMKRSPSETAISDVASVLELLASSCYARLVNQWAAVETVCGFKCYLGEAVTHFPCCRLCGRLLHPSRQPYSCVYNQKLFFYCAHSSSRIRMQDAAPPGDKLELSIAIVKHQRCYCIGAAISGMSVGLLHTGWIRTQHMQNP